MFAKKIVAKHVVSTTLVAMLGATLLLSGLQVLFTYLGELGDVKGDYTAGKALLYVLWGAPYYLYEIIPIAALIGAVVGLGSMASNSELVVMRAAGISLWRIVAWVMRSAVILVIISLALSEWVIPYTSEQAKKVKDQQYAAKLGEVRGYWTKEDNQFVYIDYANAQGQLRHIQTMTFSDEYYLSQWSNAKQGQFVQDGQWRLNNVVQTKMVNYNAHQQHLAEQDLNLALKPEYVHMVTMDAEDLSPSQLMSLMHYMNQYSQVPKPYQLAFWQKIMSPFALMALVLIACSFIFGPLRQQSMGFRLVIALFTGLGFFYLQDFLGYASLVYSPSPAWFVCVPIVLMFMIGAYLLHRAK